MTVAWLIEQGTQIFNLMKSTHCQVKFDLVLTATGTSLRQGEPHATCHMPYAICHMPQARLRPEMRTAWLTFARLQAKSKKQKAKSKMHYSTDSSETNDINWVSAEQLKWLPSRAGLLKSHLERAPLTRCRPGISG